MIAITTFRPTDAASLVFPAISLLWYALAVFLVMLGLVGEVAIREHRIQGMKILPLLKERQIR